MAEQAATVAAGEGETQVLDIDPAQLAALLAQSADGTAQLIDEHGNTITLTADQLAEAGIDLQNLEGAQVVQLAEGQQYVQGEDGQIYIIESEDAAAGGGFIDANAVVSGLPESDAQGAKSQLEQRYSHGQDQSAGSRQVAFSATSASPKQGAAPIMAAPKPIPTAVQQHQSMSAPRVLLATDHDQHLGARHEDALSPSKMQYARRPISEANQQQQILSNSSLVNNIPTYGNVRRQATGAKQFGQGDQDAEMAFVQGDEMQVLHGGTQVLAGRRLQPAAGPTLLRRGNNNNSTQAGLLPFQCDQCPRRFAHDHHLKRHQEIAHAKKRPFFCRYCNRDLLLASDLHFQGHLRMQHKQELEYESGGQARSGQSGGQQQLQLRTAGSRPPITSPAQGAAAAASDEPEEEEPDWDTLEAEKQRDSQATTEQKVGNGQESAADAKKDASNLLVDDVQEQAGGGHKCNVCAKEYSSLEDLNKHETKEHKNAKEPSSQADGEKQDAPTSPKTSSTTYPCNACQKKFGKQEYLDKHKIAHTDQYPFPCQYCTRRFKWKENLIKHINWHMERMPFKCSLCPKGFPTQTRLDVHVKAKHLPKQREHVCPICSKAFYEKEYLAKHMRIHGSKIYPCTECDKKFIDEKFLRRHMMTHTQARDFACDVCGKAFNKAVHLKSHRTIHTGERPYKCSKCHMAFGFKHNLRAHEKAEHGSAGEKLHMCETCGRGFLQKNNLEVHMRIHRGVKPFQCSSCLKQFSRLEHLRTHVNAHAGIRDYQCTVCEKNFSSKANLQQHLLVHQEDKERAFHCGSCPKKFKQRQHLVTHVKTHTKNPDVQYVVIWEKGGSLLEATIITDGVPQDATGDGVSVAEAAIRGTDLAGGRKAQQQSIQMADVDAAKLLASAASGGQVLDLSQIQLVDEEGNPIQNITSDQLLILQDGTIAATSADGTATTVAAAGAGAETTMIDPSALLALAADAQGEDGTIYISEENLQALAQQGVVFSYQEAGQ